MATGGAGRATLHSWGAPGAPGEAARLPVQPAGSTLAPPAAQRARARATRRAAGYCRAPPATLEVGDDGIDNDDVQLVDNFAAASLFSPNMWVQRPGQARARRPDQVNADDK